MKKYVVVAAALACVVVASLFLPFRRTNAQPNVLLITIDTLRQSRVHCFGYEKPITPNIDQLGAEGALFQNAYCDVTWTTPSMSSVMTGSYATRHGMRSTYQQLDPSNVTLAEALKQHGYHTAAIIGSFPLDHSFGLNQGFDFYDDHFTTPIVTGGDANTTHLESSFSSDLDAQRLYQYQKAQADAYRPDNQVTDAAVSWLQQQRQAPFFLWVHYFGPHELNDMRLNLDEQDRQIISTYDAGVQSTDAEVGRLLAEIDALGLRPNTVVILHADHGQSLGEHLYVGHGKNLYEFTLRIPLIVRLPGVVPAGKVVQALARNIDIMPTVLDLAGVHLENEIDGESLRPLWSRGAAPERELYCETYLPATDAFAEEVKDAAGKVVRIGFRRLGMRQGPWMFVLNEPWPLLDYANPAPLPAELVKSQYSEELYNLAENPFELRRMLVSDRPDIARALREKIRQHNNLAGHVAVRRELDEAAKERMRSLGYMH